jgi:hypothetical protein
MARRRPLAPEIANLFFCPFAILAIAGIRGGALKSNCGKAAASLDGSHQGLFWVLVGFRGIPIVLAGILWMS